MSRTTQGEVDVLALIAGAAFGIAVLTYFYAVFGAVVGFTPTSGSFFYFPAWLPLIGGWGPVHHEVWGSGLLIIGGLLIAKGGPYGKMLGFAFVAIGATWILDDYYLHCLSQPYGACTNWP